MHMLKPARTDPSQSLCPAAFQPGSEVANVNVTLARELLGPLSPQIYPWSVSSLEVPAVVATLDSSAHIEISVHSLLR